ncbi:hypothetical protein PFICI_15371 [Pestalotiopsis fici W106-1]|uniref:AB hydrolase-1 domain-containing protein n=1 Tax=Pestalotiopsis fici (strain W106-1 / CGMCC3.15140) TaxID=1229662 RepID=W3WGP9_PESFW|nr:uncharacterized protein PFICI_15371 [Pestalotiopsis fici W106-1]ETS72979.1 hypothetical protein PFICI_15371 [Pestalotiopsis fici W106-1]
MGYAPSSSTSAAGSYAAAPIPRQPSQYPHSSGRRSLRLDVRTGDDGTRRPFTPASPEVISSLITSLSGISEPANTYFNKPLPVSPGHGSFGVDYGAFRSSSLRADQEDNVPLDELAACPPVIRTAPPPSGLSPLTTPKSPRSPRRESSGGLRSLLRSSRPSSRSSASSYDDNRSTRSIGNPSIEPGTHSTQELHRQRSQDSWGKKPGRNSKGLMYMSSKERLRAGEAERKRSSFGVLGGALDSVVGGPLSPRTDSSLAETPISEEPPFLELDTPYELYELPEPSPTFDQAFQRPVPARDSSLRRTSSSTRRSSRRSKREGESNVRSSIPENEEHDHFHDMSLPKRTMPARSASANDANRRKEDTLRADLPTPSRLSVSPTKTSHEKSNTNKSRAHSEDPLEDGAPYPAVYSSRRRTSRSADRRKSGRTTPEPGDALKMKRSSSRLSRLSVGPKSPEQEKAATPERIVSYERPKSVDSVDDAVESYLCSPRLSQKIKHPQTGRVISFSEVGDSEGSAVFCCVGMGLTRYIMAFYDELALTLKLRLITPDRPGVGDSEPYADGTATPLSWPDDVYAICQALKITKFSILAHSAGAIYALATALRMPQHIRGRIHLLAPWIPPSQMNVFGTSQAMPPTNAIPTSQRILRALPTPFLKAANSSFMTATSSSITSSLPKEKRKTKRKATAAATGRRDTTPNMDKENMAGLPVGDKDLPAEPTESMDQIKPHGSDFGTPHPAAPDAVNDDEAEKERQVSYDTRLTYAIWDLATTGANPAVDLLVCLERRHTVGFRYVDITRPVVIHHGSRDNRVPVDNVRWLGKTMRRCEVRVLEGEGHGLMASATVMGNVLMEISKEWEDWNKATGSQRERGRSFRVGGR